MLISIGIYTPTLLKVIVYARTDPKSKPAHGITAFIVEEGFPGFQKGIIQSSSYKHRYTNTNTKTKTNTNEIHHHIISPSHFVINIQSRTKARQAWMAWVKYRRTNLWQMQVGSTLNSGRSHYKLTCANLTLPQQWPLFYFSQLSCDRANPRA